MARAQGGSSTTGEDRPWWVAIAWIYAMTIAAASVWTLAANDYSSAGTSWGTDVIWTVVLVLFTSVGAFVVHHRPSSTIGWLLLAPGLAGAEMLTEDLLADPPAGLDAGVWLALVLDNFSWLMLIFPTILVLALFPTGRAINPRWRWHTRAVVGLAVLLPTLWAIGGRIGPLEGDWTIRNPIAIVPPLESIPGFMPLWSVGLMGITVGALVSMVMRYRRAGTVERHQVRWLLYAVSLFAAVYVPLQFLNEHVSGLVIDLAFGASLLFIPVAMAIAILRHQVFDIDVVIRRTIVYALVTAMLAGFYLVSVLAFQTILQDLAGVDSSFGVAASTLVTARLFNPVRRQTQLVVGRRFFRSTYDAPMILERFGSRTRAETDMTTLTGQLFGAIDDALRPSSIGVWLPGPGGYASSPPSSSAKPQ